MKMKTKLFLIAVGAVIVLAALAGLLMMTGGPKLEDYVHLLEPRMVSMDDQMMVVVVADGEPNKVAGKAFGLLYKTYYKLKGVPKGPKQPAPRARWAVDANTPKSTWEGRYGLPVPHDIDMLPEGSAGGDDMSVVLTMWEYGPVAEILHIGPYEKEGPTIHKLHQFIEEQGYKIAGPHEEEYIRGPGMFGRDDPEKYITIIRNRVRPASQALDPISTYETP